MIKFLTGSIVVLALAACNNNSSSESPKQDSGTKMQNAPSTVVSDQEKADGWVALFDGQSTKGWHKYGGDPVGTAWKITDGTLYLDSSIKKGEDIVGGGDIVTDAEYDNFDLKLDWKIAKGGNSGIMFNVNEDTMKFKRSYESGPEMQI